MIPLPARMRRHPVAAALLALGLLLPVVLAAQAAPDSAVAGAPVAVPPADPRALAYAHGNTVLWGVNALVGLLLPALFLATGLSPWLRDRARRLGGGWLLTLVAYFVLFSLVYGLLGLPLAYYEGFVREHAFGLSRQTLGKWVHDAVVGGAVALGIGVLVVWIPYLLLRRSPRRWWLWSAVAAIPVVLFLQLVAPVWLDPLFNRFEPLDEPKLAADLGALAHRAGLAHVELFRVDKSVDTRAVNAYVTGLGGTERIVLWDTLLRGFDERQILAVTAHELGHYVLHHTRILVAFTILSLLVALWLVDRGVRLALARWGARLRLEGPADPAAMPLFLAVGGLVSLLLGPAALALSRHLEHEADRFALELTRDNHALATSFVRLGAENLSDPRPSRLVVLLRYSHPPLAERIAFANSYRPWAHGAPLRYGRLLTPPAGDARR